MIRSLGIGALGALTLVACAVGVQRWVAPPRDTLRFSHARHIEADLDCATCHMEVYEAEDLSAWHMPEESTCMECHSEWREAGECSRCHTAPERAFQRPPRRQDLKMSHLGHLERDENEDCGACHKSLSEPGAPAPPPPMEACASCHLHEKALTQGDCAQCHSDLKRYPLKPISLFAHGPGFSEGHGELATTAGQQCATCHTQPFCADCHAAPTAAMAPSLARPEALAAGFIHRDDFLARHSFEARAAPDRCSRCHSQDTCQSCHAQEGLADPAGPRNPHPEGWMSAIGGGGHGAEARRDISSCASCHDQGARSICVDCHKVGGVGGDPHPVGFTLEHSLSEVAGRNLCLTCHPAP